MHKKHQDVRLLFHTRDDIGTQVVPEALADGLAEGLKNPRIPVGIESLPTQEIAEYTDTRWKLVLCMCAECTKERASYTQF